MPAALRLSLHAAKPDKLFYLVANVIVVRPSDGRCLMLQRSLNEAVHPGQYCFPGGKLEWADLDINHPTRVNGDVLDFEDAVERLVATLPLSQRSPLPRSIRAGLDAARTW